MSTIHSNIKKTIISVCFISIFLILCSIGVSAQNWDRVFQINDFLEFSEYSENIDSIHVNQSINIPLYSEHWMITDIEMNFSDIQLEREIKIVEDGGNGWDEVKRGQSALGVEINVTESTELFGVEIHGSLQEGTPLNPLYIQIQGYNPGPDTPNGTILGQVLLNMSVPFTWYRQMFSTAISLSPGQYYLVLIGPNILPPDKSVHIWTYNDVDPMYPDLHSSKYSSSWSTGVIGRPYRYKLIQKVYRSYDPEEINMTAVIDGVPHTIYNGAVAGTGVLNVSDLNLKPNSDMFDIPVQNNASVEMEFELKYKINLSNQFPTDAQMTIQQGSDVQWLLSPNIQRSPTNYNYSVEFNYPDSWFEIEVFRNSMNVSSEIIIDAVNNVMRIVNDTIFSDASWIINANSPNFQFGIMVPKTTYESGQLIELSVDPPHQSGNLTFIFVDSLGIEKFNRTISVALENSFSYEIPYGLIEGSYYALIYWNNQTDAGLAIQQYNIIVPFTLTRIELILTIIGSLSLPLIGIISYQSVKRTKRKKDAIRQEIINKYQDVLNLEHIIIADKKSGLDIYDQSITGKGLEASLITGFLEAIRSFGIELTNSDRESQTIKLEYHNSKIVMSEFKNLRITLIMKEIPSQDFLDGIKSLSQEIEEKYSSDLENFRGKTTAFKNLNFYIAKHLNTTLIYPLKLNLDRKRLLTPDQKSLIQRVKSILKQNKSDYFYVSQLFSEKKGFNTSFADSILKLIDKGVFTQKI